MKAFNYDRSRKSADRLIQRFGVPQGESKSGYIRRAGPSVGGDPWNPSTAGAITDYPAKFVVVDYSKRDRDGTLILQNDRRVLMSALGLAVVPTDSDRLVIGGQAFEIMNVTSTDPANTGAVMYELQVRM